jgi:hypothetical protein
VKVQQSSQQLIVVVVVESGERYHRDLRKEARMVTSYLDKLINGEHSTVAVLNDNVDVEVLNELSNFVRRDGAATLPYP